VPPIAVRFTDCCVCVDLQSYALSVRVLDEETNTFSIKHYRIRKFHDGQVAVSERIQFSSVVELVAYYRGQFNWTTITLFISLSLYLYICTVQPKCGIQTLNEKVWSPKWENEESNFWYTVLQLKWWLRRNSDFHFQFCLLMFSDLWQCLTYI